MNKKNYTSLKLSKWLHENGCKLESDYIVILSKSAYDDYAPTEYIVKKGYKNTIKFYKKPRKQSYKDINITCIGRIEHEVISGVYPTYDILNDICVKYAKEFFGENLVCSHCGASVVGVADEDTNWCGCATDSTKALFFYNYIGFKILELLQQNKKQEAENYIKKHCKFNKK